MRIGLFHDFKGADTVLITCGAEEVLSLKRTLSTWWASGGAFLSLHELATPFSQHACELYAVRAGCEAPKGHHLVLDLSAYQTTQELLEPMAEAECGHQYIDLENPRTQLMVSVGEYEDAALEKIG